MALGDRTQAPQSYRKSRQIPHCCTLSRPQATGSFSLPPAGDGWEAALYFRPHVTGKRPPLELPPTGDGRNYYFPPTGDG